jgi:hypothetical protein
MAQAGNLTRAQAERHGAKRQRRGQGLGSLVVVLRLAHAGGFQLKALETCHYPQARTPGARRHRRVEHLGMMKAMMPPLAGRRQIISRRCEEASSQQDAVRSTVIVPEPSLNVPLSEAHRAEYVLTS